MRINLLIPAFKLARSGNRTTALRWARIFRSLGHRVRIDAKEPVDLMVALNAWRSAEAIANFRKCNPSCPIIVALTGTDIYRFLYSHPETTLLSLTLADALVGLHELVPAAIPTQHQNKLRIIYQSARPLRKRTSPIRDQFEVLVIGHLRDEKDPLRAAEASRLLPENSRICVVHLGRAHDETWAARAMAEMDRNPRYIWRGEVTGEAVRRALARAPLMVLSSVMEGGANVISEAVVAGVPVLASEIAGSVGLLGVGYPGYFPVGDSAALARQMLRAEQDPSFLDRLRQCCAQRAALFDPRREVDSWCSLLKSLRV
jgi:putative glycosyltransferase (TIGR04348 family)